MKKTLDDESIVAEYVAGDSIGTIARRRGVASDTVSSRIRAAGVTLRVWRRAFSLEEVRTMRALSKGGMTTRQLAHRYGVTQSAMWKIVAGLSYPDAGGFISRTPEA